MLAILRDMYHCFLRDIRFVESTVFHTSSFHHHGHVGQHFHHDGLSEQYRNLLITPPKIQVITTIH